MADPRPEGVEMGVYDDDDEPTDLKGAALPEGDDDLDDDFDDDDDDFDDDDDDDDDADDLEPFDGDDDDDYDLEDATDDDIDFVVELHREDGHPVGSVLAPDLANDLDELITQLSRMPGDAGSTGLVSISSEFFVIARVRGRNVQVLLSDGGAANDWPLARDVVDYLGLPVPDEDDEPTPLGDLNVFADIGLSALEMEMLIDTDEDSDVALGRVMEKVGLGRSFEKVVDAYND